MLEVVIEVAVVGDAVEWLGGTESLVLVEDDGRSFALVLREAGVANEDGLLTEVARCFVTLALEGKGVIDADLSGGFEVEEFVVELGILKEMNAPKVEAEAVDRLHAEGAVFAGVVGIFNPTSEVLVEFVKATDGVEVTGKELVADGAKEAFDFSF